MDEPQESPESVPQVLDAPPLEPLGHGAVIVARSALTGPHKVVLVHVGGGLWWLGQRTAMVTWETLSDVEIKSEGWVELP